MTLKVLPEKILERKVLVKFVPCNLYGSKKDEKGNVIATPFSVTNEGLRNLIYTPHIYTVNLDIDGQVCKAIMKEIQFHPVKDNVLHVDFYQIEENQPIVMYAIESPKEYSALLNSLYTDQTEKS